MHGGKAARGLAHYRVNDTSGRYTTNGRYSKYLPGRLADRYQQAISDQELLNLRHEIGLADTRISELLQRLPDNADETWDGLKESVARLAEAYKARNEPATDAAFAELRRMIEQSQDDYKAWSQIMEITEQRRKLVESEGKRLAAMQQSMTAEQAVLLLSAVVGTIKQHVTDRKILAAIGADIEQLMAAQPGAVPARR